MEKIRILGIAPYDGMQNLMRQVAEKREDVELSVYVGDLETGAGIARQHAADDFDVILSRGGTAELIRQESALPVVDIPLSIHDILRSIKLAENINDKYAIIGFPAITRNAHFLCDVLQYRIDIHTIHNEAEARACLETLASEGCSMVLCDMITKSLAQQAGIPAILIASGTESVESAFDQAVSTARMYRRLSDQVRFYTAILNEQQKYTFVYNETGELVYSPAGVTLPQSVTARMAASAAQLPSDQQKNLHCEAAGSLYQISGTRREINGQTFALYSASVRKTPVCLAKSGILYSSKEEAFDQFFNSFYGITQSSLVTDMTLEQAEQSAQPVMILGEVGTGKDQMVRLIYAKGQLCNNPMVTVDCSCLNERIWTFLMENESSPLCDINCTMHIKNIKALSEGQFLQLFNTIKDLGVHQRNRLLLTYSHYDADELDSRCQHLIHLFSCLVVQMPPLRSFVSGIPSLASLYISMLNMQMAKEIIGFEPDALASLQAYNWPYNFDQFKRVISELVTLTDGSFIRLASVEKILKRENQLMYTAPKPANAGFDTTGTLEEMTLTIVQQVMAEEQGNQNATAKRLGISRTTLWRMLQKTAPSPSAD